MQRSRVQGGWNKVPGKKFQHAENKQNYSFESKSVMLKPQEITINENGTYDISHTEKGISSLIYIKDYYDSTKAGKIFQTLYNDIKWEQKFDYKPDGTKIIMPRLVAWYGDMPYTYVSVNHTSNSNWHPLLLEIKTMLETTPPCSLERPPVHFNSVLLNLYRHEHDSVDWHSDNEPELRDAPYIASLSFGEVRNFSLRQKLSLMGQDPPDYEYSQHIKVPFDSGSLVIMKGATQNDWQHKIPKEYHNRGPRINLTFRKTYDLTEGTEG